jgi:5-methylcytosine-specific restriction protein A
LARPVGLPRSRIPVILVCGAPGSGKTTYVREHASARDLVIDLDVIRANLSGLGIHAEASAWTSRALQERNRILASLANDRRHERCWFILGGAKRIDRDHWSNMLGAVEVRVMDTPLAEIERRIWSDPTRDGRQRLMVAWARRWFAEFTP